MAQRTGLRTSALRYYERAGLVEPVARVAGRRHYDPSVLHRLRVVAYAQDAGFTIAEIHELLAGDASAPGQWRELAERKLTEVDNLLAKVQAMRALLEQGLRCDCSVLDACPRIEEGAQGSD